MECGKVEKKMSEYTQGPLEVRSLEGVWSVFEAKTLALTARCPDGPGPCSVKEVTSDEALANAQLYAAAPDMLEALKAFTRKGASPADIDRAYELAHAAIAKAERGC